MADIPFLRFSEEPFTLHSGRQSHFLIDAGLLFACEPLRQMVLDCWLSECQSLKQHERVQVYGIPTGGVQWAAALAARIGAKLCLERQNLDLVYPVIAVDDVVTTGASLGAIPATKRLAVVDRGHNSRIFCVWRMPLP